MVHRNRRFYARPLIVLFVIALLNNGSGDLAHAGVACPDAGWYTTTQTSTSSGWQNSPGACKYAQRKSVVSLCSDATCWIVKKVKLRAAVNGGYASWTGGLTVKYAGTTVYAFNKSGTNGPITTCPENCLSISPYDAVRDKKINIEWMFHHKNSQGQTTTTRASRYWAAKPDCNLANSTGSAICESLPGVITPFPDTEDPTAFPEVDPPCDFEPGLDEQISNLTGSIETPTEPPNDPSDDPSVGAEPLENNCLAGE